MGASPRRFNCFMTRIDRRHFLRSLGALGVGAIGSGALPGLGPSTGARAGTTALPFGFPEPGLRLHGLSSDDMALRYGPHAAREELLRAATEQAEERIAWAEIGRTLRARFDDLPRHFIFEYYPWYANDPFRHWQQWHRVPPIDIAATSYPLLGAYDSRSTRIIERHAQWIREAGVGAVNLSWWGPGSFEDQVTHRVMDVMAAHDLKVTFHLEPYRNDRIDRYVGDLTYLLREFGSGRGWDCFLVLRDASGREGPVFKSFRTILPETVIDCHGTTWTVPDYVPDEVWAQRTDELREGLRYEFDFILLLADSLNVKRVNRAGFDGCAPYSNFITPDEWRRHADRCEEESLTFSFNCNAGYDGIERRRVPADSCYVPTPFLPPADLDWSQESDRERARRLAQRQIARTLRTSVRLQADPGRINWRRGHFLVYVNSFNEWHEGTQFEPALDWNDLTEEQRAVGYHNAARGPYRLRKFSRMLRPLLDD